MLGVTAAAASASSADQVKTCLAEKRLQDLCGGYDQRVDTIESHRYDACAVQQE
jgi:hypothetical protein